uniref:Uncharacterized protein n=1 Tax=Cacopsylla melanoneura TaxID=428564 RepID=A0A8D8SJF7_9HEMI
MLSKLVSSISQTSSFDLVDARVDKIVSVFISTVEIEISLLELCFVLLELIFNFLGDFFLLLDVFDFSTFSSEVPFRFLHVTASFSFSSLLFLTLFLELSLAFCKAF